MTDPDFLTELHARFEAPRPVVVDLIERETHGSVHELRRLTLGDENEVYQARLSDGSAVYARIRRPGEDTFGPEIWAMERAGSAGVPIPHVLAVDEIVTEGGPVPSCWSRNRRVDNWRSCFRCCAGRSATVR